MKLTTASLIAIVIAAPPVGAAQLYRWVDEKGHVEWRDTPPPASATNVERRRVTASTIPTADVPYGVKQSMKNFPVTLWVNNCGETCNRARAHLAGRGVPYTERNPLADSAAFRQASGGSMDVPLLIVGTRQTKGYLASDWDTMLDTAGYPRSPYAGYRPPAPVPDPKAASAPQPGKAAPPAQPQPSQ